jgi:hypothetical protein
LKNFLSFENFTREICCVANQPSQVLNGAQLSAHAAAIAAVASKLNAHRLIADL